MARTRESASRATWTNRDGRCARVTRGRPRAARDPTAYAEFRKGLLRHIGMEENILLPVAQRARDGQPLPADGRLRLDHGALAALLVPTPTPTILGALRGILARHSALEEGPDGVYANKSGSLRSRIGVI